jgi:hypothetical protein
LPSKLAGLGQGMDAIGNRMLVNAYTFMFTPVQH